MISTLARCTPRTVIRFGWTCCLLSSLCLVFCELHLHTRISPVFHNFAIRFMRVCLWIRIPTLLSHSPTNFPKTRKLIFMSGLFPMPWVGLRCNSDLPAPHEIKMISKVVIRFARFWHWGLLCSPQKLFDIHEPSFLFRQIYLNVNQHDNGTSGNEEMIRC